MGIGKKRPLKVITQEELIEINDNIKDTLGQFVSKEAQYIGGHEIKPLTEWQLNHTERMGGKTRDRIGYDKKGELYALRNLLLKEQKEEEKVTKMANMMGISIEETRERFF